MAAELFNLYINDINKCLKYSKIRLFADDTLLFIVGKDVQVMSDNISEDLDLNS